MASSGSSYFIKIRGRVLGPYTLKQLNTLRIRGQFSESNEISKDGKTWQSAGTLEPLFGSANKTRKKPTPSTETAEQEAEAADDNASASDLNASVTFESGAESASPATGREGANENQSGWYYTFNEEQRGPVLLDEIKEQLTRGRLTAESLVWKRGMGDWSVVSSVPELQGVPLFQIALEDRPLTKIRDSLPKSRNDLKDFDSEDSDDAPHFLDHLLAALRRILDESLISKIGDFSVEIGRYATYLAIVLNMIIGFVFGARVGSKLSLLGIGFAAIALVLQYSAIKSCSALKQLLQTTSLRMSSTAFLDSMALMMFVGGVVGLCGAVWMWQQLDQILYLITGIAIFLAVEQLGILLLHPGAFGISISRQASVGENAISIVSFFMMLPLRFVPTIFGLGTALSLIGTILALWLVATASAQGSELSTSYNLAYSSGYSTLCCAAVPLLAYIYFLFAYLLVDLIHSILILPDKIQKLAQRSAAHVGGSSTSNVSSEAASNVDATISSGGAV
jgi:hypothetical protein